MMTMLRNGATCLACAYAWMFLSGCGECGRRLFFFTEVTDQMGGPVESAAVTVECVDAHDGSQLSDSAVTDSTGRASPAVHALNRECPDNAEAHASYFRSCTITVDATGYDVVSRSLSGEELDGLPEGSAGEAGHGVKIEITLRRP